MSWRYLTNAYVEAMGMRVVPVRLGRDALARLTGRPVGRGHLPAPPPSPYREAVFFRGQAYLRDDRGWTRL